MTTRVYINGTLLFEAAGDLMVTRDVFKIAGFDQPLDSIHIKVVGETAEVHLEWDLKDQLSSSEKAILAADPSKKIPVIKAVRDRTQMGLKDAKDLVDAYCAGN